MFAARGIYIVDEMMVLTGNCCLIYECGRLVSMKVCPALLEIRSWRSSLLDTPSHRSGMVYGTRK